MMTPSVPVLRGPGLSEVLASSRVPPQAGALLQEAPVMLDLMERPISAGKPVDPGQIERLTPRGRAANSF